MSDTCAYIADSARAGNDARRTITAAEFDPEADAIGSYCDTVAAIGAAVRNGAPVPSTGYFASGRGPAGARVAARLAPAPLAELIAAEFAAAIDHDAAL